VRILADDSHRRAFGFVERESGWPGSIKFDIVLLSAVVIWLELALIRWLPAHVPYLAFTTHLILVASVFGVVLGFAAPNHPHRVGLSTPAAVTAIMIGGKAIEAVHEQWFGLFAVSQKDEYFGLTHPVVDDLARFPVPIGVMVIATFVLVSWTFVSPARAIGGSIEASARPRTSYLYHLIGGGIGATGFAWCSYHELSPIVWIGTPMLGLVFRDWLLAGVRLRRSILALGPVLILINIPLFGLVKDWRQIWSPYSRIQIDLNRFTLRVNLMGHQQMVGRASPMRGYSLPYDVIRSERVLPKSVLVIGAGAGNDVSHALAAGAEWVTAVELDPAIARLGRELHPDQPYQDPRVVLIVGDGRRHLATTRDKYDLVVYGFVDTLVRHSSYTGLRSESFLYTLEAFNHAKRVLNPGGRLVLYEYFRQGWLVSRLKATLETVFGVGSTAVYTMPARPSITPVDDLNGAFTMLVVGDHASNSGRFNGPRLDVRRSTSLDWADLSEPPRPEKAAVEAFPEAKLATDDWPYPYMSSPGLSPLSIRQWTHTTVAAVTLGLLMVLSGRISLARSDPRSFAQAFLLGAAFMLLQARMVSQSALLFGSTWLVTAAVIISIMFISAIGTFLSGLKSFEHSRWVGVFLIMSIVFSTTIPTDFWLSRFSFGPAIGGLVFAMPLVFSGTLFGALLRRAPASSLIAANAFGTICGAFLENLSTVIGFRGVSLVTCLLYGTALLARGKVRQHDGLTEAPVTPDLSRRAQQSRMRTGIGA
jgi:SAM-dependent methyltransferase